MEKTKTSQNNNKFKISALTWNDKFELPDGLYSVSNIQDYFEYILKNHRENINNLLIYVDKTENRITFRIKNGYSLGNTENKIVKDKNGENVRHLEIAEVVLVHCNVVNNDYQKVQKSCTHLFEINHLVVFQKILQQIIFFKKYLTLL